MRKLLSLAGLYASPLLLWGQIYLINPSFEGDEPQDATVPAGWHACKMGTTPDILPGIWGVYTEPSEGETFVGLITRADGTWESIGQRLSAPVLPKDCYTITLDLAHSKTYAGYNNPIRLRIWGGVTKCNKDQLLAESKFIEHTDWETYSFQFVPKQPLNYIILEANYTDGSNFSYQGNILIDNVRPIKTCIRAEVVKE
ncbi:MAG: hypothetical protein H6563_07785 [Lewinellaceae bacterium]|nr:hypothetical protein [Lewinellaceae bacterium]